MDPYAVSVLLVTFVVIHISVVHAIMAVNMQNPLREFHRIIVCTRRLLGMFILYDGCSEVTELLYLFSSLNV